MARSIWKGDISFGLVTIPVSLVSTEENNDIRFHFLNAKTHARVHYKRVDEQSGKEVPWNDVVKGYEYDTGNYIVLNDEAFEKTNPELFKSIPIEEFVDLQDIDHLFYQKPYYLLPEGKNKKAYTLLREALKKTNKVGVAKIILRTKEYLSIILPHHHALLLYLLYFKEDIRAEEALNLPKETLKNYKISQKEIDMAVDLITDMSTSWQPEKYRNDYQDALQKWLNQHIAAVSKSGKPSKKMSGKDSVVDFVALLKDSMKNKGLTTKKTVAKSKHRKAV